MSLASELVADLEDDSQDDLDMMSESGGENADNKDADSENDGDDDDEHRKVSAEDQLMIGEMDARFEQLEVSLSRVRTLDTAHFLEFLGNHAAVVKRENSQGSTNLELVYNSMTILTRIEQELQSHNKTMRDLYAPRFPELDSMLPRAIDYAKTVLCFGAAEDLSKVELKGVLNNQLVMVVTMSASTTSGRVLESEKLEEVVRVCKTVVFLCETRDEITKMIESSMLRTAPNVSALVGTEVAARLVTIAGGIQGLAKIPGGTMQFLGKRKSTHVFIASGDTGNVGVIWSAPAINDTPIKDRKKVQRLLCNRVALCARMDSFHQTPDGARGKEYLDEIRKKIAKWQEPPPAKRVKAITPFDKIRKKKRGGRRFRNMKERYKISETEKRANRVKFAELGEDLDDSEDDHVGKKIMNAEQTSSTGAVRRVAVKTHTQKHLAKKLKTMDERSSGGGGAAASGFQTSFAMTPSEGIALHNPQAEQRKIWEANQKYFGTATPFVKK